MSNSWSDEKEDAMREEEALRSRLVGELRKLTPDQIAELPSRELIALAIKVRR